MFIQKDEVVVQNDLESADERQLALNGNGQMVPTTNYIMLQPRPLRQHPRMDVENSCRKLISIY